MRAEEKGGGPAAETADHHETSSHHRDQVVEAMSTRDVGEVVLVPHVFQFHCDNIRAFDIDGIRAAVGADICKALDIKDPPKALAKLDCDDKVTLRRSDTTALTQGIWEQMSPQVQSVTLISENGATDLILESRKPEARAFRRWLTHEVWPAIRETGSYSIAPALEGPELLAVAVIEAQKVIQAREARIAELEPKADFYDELMDADGCYSMKATANALGWGRNVMMRELRRAGILTGNNLPYQSYAHHFKVVPQTYTTPAGETIATATTYVLPCGLEFLRRRLAKSVVII
jgi:prophage antirepressor-like protein